MKDFVGCATDVKPEHTKLFLDLDGFRNGKHPRRHNLRTERIDESIPSISAFETKESSFCAIPVPAPENFRIFDIQ